MSWLKFWRGQRSSDPKPVNESEASKASYEALLNALSQGNQDEAGRQLNWLRSHCRRANAEAAERWLFALALHHARNAARYYTRLRFIARSAASRKGLVIQALEKSYDIRTIIRVFDEEGMWLGCVALGRVQ